MKIKAKKKVESSYVHVLCFSTTEYLEIIPETKLIPLPNKTIANVEDCLFVGYASDKEWENNTAALNNEDLGVVRTTSPTGNQTPFLHPRETERVWNACSIQVNPKIRGEAPVTPEAQFRPVTSVLIHHRYGLSTSIFNTIQVIIKVLFTFKVKFLF